MFPSTLYRPQPPPQLIYLDLNHWISLSKAVAKHKDGESFVQVFNDLLKAVNEGRAIFPIGSGTYYEVTKISQYGQRRNLRNVIEALSRFFVLTDLTVIIAHECEALLDSVIGPSAHPINQMDYLDWGVFRALGRVGGLRIKTKDGRDVTKEFRDSFSGGPEAFDSIVWEMEIKFNRQILDGPTGSEESELRNLGWNPRSAFAVAESRAKMESEVVLILNDDPGLRKDRLRDFLSARYLVCEYRKLFEEGLLHRGKTFGEFLSDIKEARGVCDSMPSFDAVVTMKTSLHRDSRHEWTPNDIFDLDAIGAALPYCDAVVLDNEMRSHCTRNGLDQRLKTKVFSNLFDLVDFLEA